MSDELKPIFPVVTRVRYSCGECEVTNVELELPARDPDEPFDSWWQLLRDYLAVDHAQRSPECESTVFEDVYADQPGAKITGGPPIH